ncbi:GNAT family N-acetyltransferase [Halostella sp. JP-L12]|uniref:GNAT family N-acetyltransferase n=1 Tax=Halostella TaxID=1843185 RepID=UPI000EF7EF9F|nr:MULTISPECIES: GNAT family N-acetyltransferase [Halostella]NHN48370.1 GNAT family N-acetyltransferase [Halostella sp. JP-L12]
MEIRSYDPDTDGSDLWELKRAFERGLGANTGGEEKEAAYEGKLTDDYRVRYLDWVERCTDSDPDCVTVASTDDGLAGYAFLLPERLSMIWDAAVLNEIYVDPDHRGTGVADDLIEAVLSTAREQDLPLDRIVLDVDPKNDRAQAFYDRYGFEQWGEMVARSL